MQPTLPFWLLCDHRLHITVGAIYKLFWLFLCLYALPRVIDRYRCDEHV